MTITEAPSWIDLDALAPASLRAEAGELLEAIRVAYDALKGTSDRIIDLIAANERAYRDARDHLCTVIPQGDVEDMEDGLAKLVSVATGRERVVELLFSLNDLVDPEELLTKGEKIVTDERGPVYAATDLEARRAEIRDRAQ